MKKHSNVLVEFSENNIFFGENESESNFQGKMFALIQNSKKTDKMSWTNLILQTNLTDSFIRRIVVEFDCMALNKPIPIY